MTGKALLCIVIVTVIATATAYADETQSGGAKGWTKEEKLLFRATMPSQNPSSTKIDELFPLSSTKGSAGGENVIVDKDTNSVTDSVYIRSIAGNPVSQKNIHPSINSSIKGFLKANPDFKGLIYGELVSKSDSKVLAYYFCNPDVDGKPYLVIETAPQRLKREKEYNYICQEHTNAEGSCYGSLKSDYEYLTARLERFAAHQDKSSLDPLVDALASTAKRSKENLEKWCSSANYKHLKEAPLLSETAKAFDELISAVKGGLSDQITAVIGDAAVDLQASAGRVEKADVAYLSKSKKLEQELGRTKKKYAQECTRQFHFDIFNPYSHLSSKK